jgi:hypothetical protein
MWAPARRVRYSGGEGPALEFGSWVRIPMKWGTDSGGNGAASEQATLVTVMISEAPHFSQEFCE